MHVRARLHGPLMESLKVLGSWVAVLGVAVAGRGPGASAAAGKYDGSAPLVCAAMTVSECDADGRCQRRNALFKVDIKAMKLWELGAEKPRETAIRNVDRANSKMILSGGRGRAGMDGAGQRSQRQNVGNRGGRRRRLRHPRTVRASLAPARCPRCDTERIRDPRLKEMTA
jgi:hypothetical protein